MLGPTGRIDVTIIHWLMAGLLLVIGLWSVRYIPDIWRGGSHFARVRQHLDVFGETAASAFAATLPLATVICASGGALALVIFAREGAQGSLRSLTDGLGNALAVVFLVCLLLGLAVFLFGLPRAVMPPHARKQRGLLGQTLVNLVRRDRPRSPR